LFYFELRQAAGAAVLSFVVKVFYDLSTRKSANTIGKNLCIMKTTFSRILVEISGNSMRPVRCSTNKPSGAVKIAATFFLENAAALYHQETLTFDGLACHGAFVVNNKRVPLCRYQGHILWGSRSRGRHSKDEASTEQSKDSLIRIFSIRTAILIRLLQDSLFAAAAGGLFWHLG
jgi:hypothetical protein